MESAAGAMSVAWRGELLREIGDLQFEIADQKPGISELLMAAED
jgi:hypothetical protein